MNKNFGDDFEIVTPEQLKILDKYKGTGIPSEEYFKDIEEPTINKNYKNSDAFYKDASEDVGINEYVDMVGKQGQYRKVNSNDVLEALQHGYKMLNTTDKVKVRQHLTGTDEFVNPDQLQSYLEDEPTRRISRPTYTDMGQEFIRGAVTKAGKIADTVVGVGSTIGGMASHMAGDVADYAGFDDVSKSLHEFGKKAISTAEDFYDNDKIASYPNEMLDSGTSHFKGSRIANAAGNVAPDLFLFKPIGKGLSPITKNLNGIPVKIPPIKFISKGKEVTLDIGNKINNLFNIERSGTNFAGFAAAGAGAELFKKDDPNTPVLENIGRELFGSLGLSTVPYMGKAGLQAGWNALKEIPKSIKELPSDVSSKIISLFSKKGDIDVETYANLTKLGIEPTPEMIVKDSKVLQWLANTRNKFSDSIIKTTNDRTLESIETSLDHHLGFHPGKNEGVEAGSTRVSELVNQELEQYIGEVRDTSRSLYEEAVGLLKDTEYPQAINTLKEAKKRLASIKGLSKGGTTETGRDVVVTRLENIISEISRQEGFTVNPQTLVNELSSLKEFMRTNNVKSFAKTLSPVIEAIEKDLLSVKGNEPYINAIKYANSYFKDNLVPFIKADISKSIIDGEAPKAAYAMMNNTENMLEVKTMLDNLPNGGEIYNMLRRVKSKEVLVDTVFDKGSFNPNKFYDLFMKSKNDEYLYELLGESYNEIKKNILPVAKMLERNKSLMANPSGTVESARKGIGMYEVGKGIVTMSPTAIAEGVTAAYGPELISKLLLDPKTSAKLVKIALKQNDVQFKKLLLQIAKNSTKVIKETPLGQIGLENTIINQKDTYNKDRVRRNGGKQISKEAVRELNYPYK